VDTTACTTGEDEELGDCTVLGAGVALGCTAAGAQFEEFTGGGRIAAAAGDAVDDAEDAAVGAGDAGCRVCMYGATGLIGS
jgi:hypothetical protein